jgi:hypothetical protein
MIALNGLNPRCVAKRAMRLFSALRSQWGEEIAVTVIKLRSDWRMEDETNY